MILEDLSEELIELCLEGLDTGALQNLRLVNRFFNPRASKLLYRHVTVYCTEHSVQNARLILDRDHLNPLIESLTLHTCDPELCPDIYEPGNEGGAELSEEYESLLGDVGRFRGLRAVELKFSRQCAVEPVDQGEKTVWESTEFRTKALTALVQGLNHEEHPATKVHNLTIECLQDVVDQTLARSHDFKAVLSRLDSLSLLIISEFDPDYDLDLPDFYRAEPYRFFGNDLRQYWLEPTREKLTHLKLHGKMDWGYLPYCNLPDLHFPKLRSLSLGRMTFTHDWQLDWIASHRSTLSSLTLDHCQIVHGANVSMQLRADRYPKLQPCESAKEDIIHGGQWTYDTRWHDYFRRLNDALPHLKRFNVNHSAFAMKTTSSRYYIFDQTSVPDGWINAEPRKTIADKVVMEYDCSWDEPPPYPDCEKEDSEALAELMEAVRGRR
ncbi:hypothetical protein LTR91_006316 [Friedmanniomyces endolithicus]|uniref:F-box domain-containing protein n=1 Tax=Friedmanniomyces endolithicus TaxID=329885 RepID=A0AAN6KTE6_9PEZI|nr:hypothetical protein LTR94_012737 [Friedmanniomyces endolithicus]KAK0772525.1 hypothetical protein LTR75_017389 [Friedmanniomyces endolithicus]KAK0807459.1 hypothetical protein LTR59_003302 [Friedmanniomyces endolithicus]KAK0809267.1 hypothetical protein LTR38_004336 [Friedmanniomyces endolithicus]KAK0842274.1 hypothetical protein LTR03_009419 [Friedmanniomyces endolithicus]